jgi:hypothetical protein
MRYLVIGLVAALAVFAVRGDTAQAHGISPAQLSDHGWNCFDVPGLGVHCQPPGDGSSSATLTFLYFDTSDPNDEDAPFLGTEILVRADLYNGQPCPQEGLDEYTGLDLFGGPEVDYYACHRK